MTNLHIRRPRRRGVSLVLVLGLVAIALALSYALLRTQMTAAQVQGNAGRQVDARQAALAGLSAAMRKLHSTDWAGVNTSLHGDLGTDVWYEATFETGDAALTENSADYAEYPFRVTITATGYAADPARPDARSSHRVSAVMQLVRRKLSSDPANWSSLQQHTIYQWANVNSYVQVPVRTEGPVLLQGPLHLCDDSPSSSSARRRYLEDLEKMRVDGRGDYRPFNGPVSLPPSRNSSTTLDLLQTRLNLVVNDVAATDSSPLSMPSQVRSYRLFPGGKLYTVQTLQSQFGSSLANRTLAADPKTNPLGLFPSEGSLTVYSNVTIVGTLLTGGYSPDVQVYGKNVDFRGRDLPALCGSSARVQLPAAIVADDFRVRDEAQGSLTGLAVVADEFEFNEGSAALQFDVQGRLITRSLHLMGRTNWEFDPLTWLALLAQFVAQIGHENNGQGNGNSSNQGIAHFPRWLRMYFGLSEKPLLTIRPDSSGVAYHWQDWSQPVYVAHPDDGGLRWDLVRWKDLP